MINRWYVKARYQLDHEQRANILECPLILEDTSSQVKAEHSLPHLILQDDAGTNHVLLEPVSLLELTALVDQVTNQSDDELIDPVLN